RGRHVSHCRLPKASCWARGFGTGRNCEAYPAGAIVSGIDTSPAGLERTRPPSPFCSRRAALPNGCTALAVPAGFFDAAVTSFLFCGLPDPLQVPALCGLGRVVKPGGLVRLLEYVRPCGSLHRVVSNIWQSWIGLAYGASFDRTPNGTCRRPALNS